MKSYLLLRNQHEQELPDAFQPDDVRYPTRLVEHFLALWTEEGDVVFDPFAGFGTTLVVAEKMGRVPLGIEYDKSRCEYARSRLQHPDSLILGDSRALATYALPPIDFSITSPPYMQKHHTENPLTNYSKEGDGYAAYLTELERIYRQIERILKPNGRVVIEVSNLKGEHDVTTLAWDVARVVSQVLHFQGEIVVGWDQYGFGYDHSYCLVFTKPT